MPDTSPLRGATVVNDELEVGYDANFEHRWRILELVSHGLMALLAVAALIGLFGRGPFSHRTEATKDGRFAVDYEPIARYGTSTQVTLHLSSSAAAKSTPVRVFINSSLVEPLGLQEIIPLPAATEAIGGGVAYSFDIPPGQDSAMVRFVLKPAVVGRVEVDANEGDDALSFVQWVLP